MIIIIRIRNEYYHIDFIKRKISKFFLLLEFKTLIDPSNSFQYLQDQSL